MLSLRRNCANDQLILMDLAGVEQVASDIIYAAGISNMPLCSPDKSPNLIALAYYRIDDIAAGPGIPANVGFW